MVNRRGSDRPGGFLRKADASLTLVDAKAFNEQANSPGKIMEVFMAEATTLSRIAAVMLGVRDMTQSLDFYRDKLGLAVIMKEDGLSLLQCGTVMLGLS